MSEKTEQTHELFCGTCLLRFTECAYAYGHGRVFCSPKCRDAYPGHDEAVLRRLPEPLQTRVRSYDGPFASRVLNWVWFKADELAWAQAPSSDKDVTVASKHETLGRLTEMQHELREALAHAQQLEKDLITPPHAIHTGFGPEPVEERIQSLGNHLGRASVLHEELAGK